MSHPYFIVDVFAEAKYAGNQLAVVLNAHDLSSAQMQSIAREMHFSETTFILGNEPRDGGYDVRIFTPEVELPFAGHPTLGTSFILRNEIIRQPVASLLLNLKVGQIPVSFQQDIVWMKQIAPTFGRTINFAAGAELLQIDGVDLDTSFPIQQVSTGLPFWIMPLKSLRAVKMARPNWVRYLELTEAVDGRTILVFAPETYHPENQLNVRVFADQEGISEDPATGSGNGCLAAYLVKYRYLNKDAIDVRVEQGYEINRPSLLWLRAQEQGGKIDVNVGGKVFMVARGVSNSSF